jgi:hypothetical protein
MSFLSGGCSEPEEPVETRLALYAAINDWTRRLRSLTRRRRA